MATRVPQKGHEGFQKNTHEGATFRPKDILKNTPEVAKKHKKDHSNFQCSSKKQEQPVSKKKQAKYQDANFGLCGLCFVKQALSSGDRWA